ncbi:SsrA-binding protein SmpB [Aliifodinibius salicampi]|uniref:SsrA-binding protein n=1 Tax=Fodinibius salicampi TaxID=1920655 RepID=A0ABT3Q2Q0_9BACT|nr:SsrA-binding protein SmpB [Fodinibius salicampi]MCW9714395.1 SsrA-binding protein SmpB [Fodinibius salicampi]
MATNTPTIKNRKARYEYHIEETYEAGIVLKGTEVKSLRNGNASLNESFAMLQDGEVWLRDMYIKPYKQGSYANHDERRPRKLLLNKREIAELDKAIDQKGYTLIPLKLYFKKGYAKVLLGIAKGKQKHDKREDIKERDVKRELNRKYKGTYKVNM